MPITTISSREFNQDTSRAKKATRKGPVIITDRGKPAHVLLTIEDYRSLEGKKRTIVKALAMPGSERTAFKPAKLSLKSRPADLS